jgi:hypothetical protein
MHEPFGFVLSQEDAILSDDQRIGLSTCLRVSLGHRQGLLGAAGHLVEHLANLSRFGEDSVQQMVHTRSIPGGHGLDGIKGKKKAVGFLVSKIDNNHRYNFVGKQLASHVPVENLVPLGAFSDDDRVGHPNLFKQCRHLGHLLRWVKANVVGIDQQF